MLRDWNFWCTVMTSVAAVVAIGVSVHQIRLSNKQQQFLFMQSKEWKQ